MEVTDAPGILRPGLLKGTRIALAGDGELGRAVRGACAALKADVVDLSVPGPGEPEAQEAEVDEAARVIVEAGAVDMLVIDADCIHGSGGRDALVFAAGATWALTRSIANLAFIGGERGGRIVYLAPRPGSGHADAACSALENLARTLSIEWSRFRITTVAVAPGAGTPAHEVAALTAYLASPAGAYYSGCLLDLRGLRA
jgi:NAD(P)-dependent dehydrogenase (short-subunit alcohol dehydrogenase family)